VIFLLYYSFNNKRNIKHIMILFKPIFLNFFNVFIFKKDVSKQINGNKYIFIIVTEHQEEKNPFSGDYK